jgi:hypothetical protein
MQMYQVLEGIGYCRDKVLDLLRISLVILAILTGVLHAFPPSLQENAAIVPRLGHE